MAESPTGVEAVGEDVGSGVGVGVDSGVLVGTEVGSGVAGAGATGVGGKTEVGTARELGGAVINVGGGGPIEVGVKVENVDVSTVSTDEDSLVETLF